MHSIATRDLRRHHDVGNIKVADSADAESLVRLRQVGLVLVYPGVGDNDLQSAGATGTQDSLRNLAAIGNQDTVHEAGSGNGEERLVEFYRRAVINQHCLDDTGMVCLDLVHHLH